MVKTALVVVVALIALPQLAFAQPPDDDCCYEQPEPEEDSPAFNMFGFTFAAGGFPVDGTNTLAMSIGLSVEHPVFRRTRIVGEYDFLWLLDRDATTQMRAGTTMVPRPDAHGTGHRTSIALRRELVGTGRGSARAFVDGELGGMLALVNQTSNGAQLVPGGFVGVRVGYDLYSRRDESPSRTFEVAMLLRMMVLPEGKAGMALGLGMFWGN
jgi:hypothetical protein